ncbi:MAG: response regulator [Fidelibacterota bacterium]
MRKILVIDDDGDIRELMQTFFESREMEVKTLTEGSKALETVIQFEPDVIILDINLPGKNGIELLKIFKEHPLAAQIPVIMLTGQTAPTMQVNGLVSGADDYVTKPFDLQILYARVISVMRRSLKQSRRKYTEMNLLRYLIGRYTKRDYTIYTKYIDEYDDHPMYWNAFVPDLIIAKGSKYRCFLFESTQSLLEETFLDRMKSMADIIRMWHRPVELNIVVRTKENERIARRIIDENSLPIIVKLIKKSSASK